MKALLTFLLLITLAASALALYFRSSALEDQEARDRAETEVRQLKNELTAADIRAAQDPAGPSSDGAPAEVLRSRIAGLEQKLTEKDEALDRLQQQLTTAMAEPEPVETPRPQPDRGGWRQRMEDLRTENPQEYARLQEERQQFVRRANEHMSGQVEFLSSLNADSLSEEYRDNHVALIEKLSALRERVSRINVDSESGDDGISRRALFHDFREIVPMLDMERQVVLNDLARDLGYAPDEAQSFVEHLDYINEMTSPRGIMRSLGGGRGGRGRP